MVQKAAGGSGGWEVGNVRGLLCCLLPKDGVGVGYGLWAVDGE